MSKKNIFMVLMILVFIGCNNNVILDLKKFLFAHPEISLQINGNGKIYDKYTPRQELNFIERTQDRELLIIRFGEKKYEILLTSKYSKIGDTDYSVRGGNGWGPEIKFKKNNLKTEKEAIKMNLSLGTWILLIISMVVIAKIAHSISLKTIFRPTKKAVKNIQKEWNDA